MNKITQPSRNTNDPDFTLAQSVAHDSGWLIDGQGGVYSINAVMVAQSLGDLGYIMRELGWFNDRGLQNSGIRWKQVPITEDERADAVRQEARHLRL